MTATQTVSAEAATRMADILCENGWERVKGGGNPGGWILQGPVEGHGRMNVCTFDVCLKMADSTAAWLLPFQFEAISAYIKHLCDNPECTYGESPKK